MPTDNITPAARQARFCVGLACVALTVTALLTGCSSDPGSGTDNGSFEGPWASSMAAMSEEGTDFVKSVLEDGVITDMEYQESLKTVEECYASHNATVSYDKYGFETVESLDGKSDPLEIMGTCARADGGIVLLYDQMRRNPDNQSEEELLAACLVRTGVVDKGFTAKDFIEAIDSPSGPPWPENDERVELCNKDPLGTLSGG